MEAPMTALSRGRARRVAASAAVVLTTLALATPPAHARVADTSVAQLQLSGPPCGSPDA
jgi:hypothetical protein